MKNIIYIFFINILSIGFLCAQTEQDTSTIKHEVVVVKAYKPEISDAFKINILPDIKDTVEVNIDFDYSINTKPLNVDFEINKINPARLVGEPLKKLYRSYLKLGFGTKFTPLAELYYNNLRSKDKSFGFYINHYSSQGNIRINDKTIYSGFNDNKAGIFGKKIYRNKILYGEANFERNAYQYYGFTDKYLPVNDMEKDSLEKQVLMNVGGRIGYKTTYTDSLHLNYDMSLGYNYMNEIHTGFEHNVNLNGIFTKFYDDELIGFRINADVYNTGFINDTVTKAVVNINPFANIVGDKWRIDAGINLSPDIYSDSVFYHIYPDINIQYNIIDNFMIPYIGFYGFLQNNNYSESFKENRYINPGIFLAPSNHLINLKAGIKGNFSPKINYNFNALYSVIKDMYFFVHDTTRIDNSSYYPLKYNAVYDDIEQLKFHGEINYQRSERLNFFLQGNYYMYTPENLKKAWHKPAMDLRFSTIYNLRDKIILNFDVFAIGDRYARAFNEDGSVDPEYLDPLIDVNLGIEYRYTKILSAFLKLNNLAGQKYNVWYGYPMYGFNALFGVSYQL